MKAPPRRTCAPGGLYTLATEMICSSFSTEQGPAITRKWPPPILAPGGEGDDRVRLVEFAVGAFIGLLDPADSLHDIQSHDVLHIYPGGVAYQSHNGVILTYRDMGLQPHTVEPGAEHLHLLLFRVFLQYDDHIFSPFPAQGLEFFE